MNPELINYIKAQMVAGSPPDAIKNALVQNGWESTSVDEAIKSQLNENASTIAPTATTNSTADTQPRLMSTQKSSNSKNPLLIISAVVILLFLVGGGVWAYFTYMRLSPEKVLAKMFITTKDITSATSETNFIIERKNPKTNTVDEAKLQLLPPGADMNKSNVSIQSKSKKQQSENRITVSSGSAILLSFDTKFDKTKLYFNARTLPNILSQFFPSEKINNTWISIDLTEPSSIGVFTGIDPAELVDQNNQKQIEDLMKKYAKTFYSSIETLSEEEVNGIKTYHYKITLNKPQLVSLLKEATMLFASDDEERKTIEEEIADLLINEDYKKSNLPKIEIWIGKKDFFIHKLAIQTSTDEIGIGNVIGSMGGDDLNFKLITTIKDHNKDFSIDFPTDAKKLDEVMASIFGAQPSSSIKWDEKSDDETNNSKNSIGDENKAYIKANGSAELIRSTNDPNSDDDNDGLTFEEEAKIYDTNPSDPDTDSDGYMDGAEVKAGYNPKGSGKLKE